MLAEDGVHCCPFEYNGFACIGGGPTRLAPPPYVRACLMLVVSCSELQKAAILRVRLVCRVELDTLHATTVTCIPGLRYIAGDLRSGPANFRFPAVFPVTRMQGCSSSWVMPKSNAKKPTQTVTDTESDTEPRPTHEHSATQLDSCGPDLRSSPQDTEARSFSPPSVHRGCPLQGAAIRCASRHAGRHGI